MKNIAIVTGGPSAERGIALNSAKLVERYLDGSAYHKRTILIEEHGWVDRESGNIIDQNDFSLRVNGEKVTFDFVFLMVHGTPVEDGKLQGYFESKGLPHSTCDTLTCALTFNKQWCKDFLEKYNVPMAESVVINSRQIDDVDIETFKYPVFVKPNNNGSSYGVSKVLEKSELIAALSKAARFDTEIMVEQFLDGREFSSGVVREGDTLHLFPITEIIPEGEFFDYDAKYLGASQEVTPADLPSDVAENCQACSGRLYELLNCQGIVRFDYILVEGTFYLLEVNTVPGMSEASIIPQQARAYGWSISQLLEVVIAEATSTT